MRSAKRRPIPVLLDAAAVSLKSSCGTASPVVKAIKTLFCWAGAIPGPVSATAKTTSAIEDDECSSAAQKIKTFPVEVNFAAFDRRLVMNCNSKTRSVNTTREPGCGASTINSTACCSLGPCSSAALAQSAPKSTTSSLGR